MTADVVKETTTQGFMKDVIEESKHQPVLVDFWAPWCGPCKQLTPVLEKAVKAAKGKVKLAKMNIDEHPAIPGQMGIQSIPAVIAFSNGQPVDGFMLSPCPAMGWMIWAASPTSASRSPMNVRAVNRPSGNARRGPTTLISPSCKPKRFSSSA